jgi:hypothetical protein
MAKKKPARKSSKGKKKKAVPRKVARTKKSSVKKSAPRAKKQKKQGKPVTMVEVAEIEVIGEPEKITHDDEFPPDYGGSE